MKMSICAIYDNKTGTYTPPFYVRHPGQAERWFLAQAMDNTSDINKFPADYSLMALGTFDDTTGDHENYEDGKRHMLSGVDAKNILVRNQGN